MNNKQVAHIWANNPGANAKGSNFYCAGDIIYSYGPHSPIACHVSSKKGARAVLMTTRSYSVSTTRHQSYVENAAHHLTVFRVPEVPTYPGAFIEWKRLFDDYKLRIADLISKAKTARKSENKEWFTSRAVELANEANRFAEFFGIRRRVKLDALDKLSEQITRDRARASKEERERRTKAEEERKERERLADERAHLTLATWINHAESGIEYGSRGDLRRLPPALRVKKTSYADAGQDGGATVETSHGAEVPIEHVRKAIRFVAAIRSRGESWNRNGHTVRVGHFQIDEIAPNGDTRAGCHRFGWSEIERFALSQGWGADLIQSGGSLAPFKINGTLESTAH